MSGHCSYRLIQERRGLWATMKKMVEAAKDRDFSPEEQMAWQNSMTYLWYLDNQIKAAQGKKSYQPLQVVRIRD